MSLSNEEIIARLKKAGVQAVSCPSCGKVKEVQDDKVVTHYWTGELICEGSGTDTLGDVQAAFDALVGELPHGPQTSDDYLELAGVAAKDVLEGLLEAIDSGVRAAQKMGVPEDVPVFVTVQTPTGNEFCGCTNCIIREVMLAVWPFAVQAEANDIVAYLSTEASREGLPKPVRKACQHIAEQIAEQHYTGYGRDD
jgi:hypothetical protein